MKQGIKKTLVMLLSLAMVFTMMAIPAYADDSAEPAAPEKILYYGDDVNFINAEGEQFGMLAPQEGTECMMDVDKIVIHYVPKTTTTYEGFSFGSVADPVYADEAAQPEIEFKANEDGSFDITLPADYSGYAHPVAVVKYKFGGKSVKSWTSSEQYYLAVPDFATDPEPLDYAGEEVNFIKANGDQFGMFTPQEGTTCEIVGEDVVIHYVPKNASTYKGFNWGTVEKVMYSDANAQIDVDVAANEDGSYDITLPASNCGYAIPVAVVKHEFGGRNNSWTSAEQYYLAVPNLQEEIGPYALRVYGSTRYQTAMLQADILKGMLEKDKFDNVIVATGTNFADALAGAYLGYVKEAPILLVRNDVQAQVNAYIKENLNAGGTIYLLGGDAVVPGAVADGIEGAKVERLSGADRYATNLAILKAAGVTNEDIMVCAGTTFADSLSASAASRPILLVKGGLNDAQREYLAGLKSEKYYLVGGTGVLPEALANEISSKYGTVERLGGADRYETSVKVAKALFDAPEEAVLAYAMNYPDGLCGGTVAAYAGAPLLLVRNDKAAITAKYTSEAGIKGGLVLGGPALISDKAVMEVFGLEDESQILGFGRG